MLRWMAIAMAVMGCAQRLPAQTDEPAGSGQCVRPGPPAQARVIVSMWNVFPADPFTRPLKVTCRGSPIGRPWTEPPRARAELHCSTSFESNWVFVEHPLGPTTGRR